MRCCRTPARPLLKALQVAISEYGWLVFLSGRGTVDRRAGAGGLAFSCGGRYRFRMSPCGQPCGSAASTGQTSEAAAWAAQLAAQFRLTPGQIRAAVELAENRRVEEAQRRAVRLRPIWRQPAGQQSHHKLRELAVKIEPHYGWDDIVLPERQLAQLHEICSQSAHQHRVFGTWGFGRKLSRGKGLSALFAGPSGTGKTMAAEVIAHELGLDLYKIDLVRRGQQIHRRDREEPEPRSSTRPRPATPSCSSTRPTRCSASAPKSVTRTTATPTSRPATCCRRWRSTRASSILATNLRENMDEAFTRRIRFIVDFPFPDEANRQRIWQTHFPPEAPCVV